MNWETFLVLAKTLSEMVEDEAAQRSAISRAYYAAFHFAQAHLKSTNRLPHIETDSSHKRVWDTFRNSSDKIERRIGGDGDRLRGYRTDADYRAICPDLKRDVDRSLTLAEATIRKIKSLKK